MVRWFRSPACVIVLLCLGCCSCRRPAPSRRATHSTSPQSASAVTDGEPLRATMTAVIANPERFDGRVVLLEGFVRIQFEEFAIFASEDDHRRNRSQNGFWLELPRDPVWYTDLNGQHCWVRGRFSSRGSRRWGIWAGGIHVSALVETRKAVHREPVDAAGAAGRKW